ncbi:MAG: FG-GAP-like repeat-containing protein [Planctomycetota bacterium]
MIAPRGSALSALVLSVVACGGPADPTVVPPREPVQDFALSEPEALRLQQDLAGLIAEPLARGDVERAARALFTPDFAARLPTVERIERTGDVEISWLAPAAESVDEPRAFLEALVALAPLSGTPDRVEVEVDRFELDPSGERATGRARLRWAGGVDDDGARVDLTLFGRSEARSAPGPDWALSRFDPEVASDDQPLGAGVVLRAGAPRFVDRTAEVGLTFGTSAENRELLQAFVDRHRTLTLGGLSVVDFDRDGRQDLIATRSGEETLVFQNDGAGGFVPIELPIERYADHPAFVLYVDLDGDGREELVASETSRYEDGRAYAGLWTRTGAEPGEWRHLPRAFALPNPVGLRRLAVQTVVPIDVEGDGDLDLFFAVYGSSESRGDRYNTVEAYDGADNHLAINQGDLVFTEESEARGITGTGYTYVALAFDADHDGDTDLFEGNDFGPNVLWRNEGGRFVADGELGFDGVSAYTMGAALADLEADGRWDLYVSNMSSEEGMRMVPHAAEISESMRGVVDTIARGNALYSEPEGGGRWDERARRLGINEGEWAWGCQFVDVDGDGGLELFVTNGFASHRNRGLGDWQTYYWQQVLDDALRLERGELSRNVNADLRFTGSFNGHERDRLFVRAAGGDPDRPWVDAGWCLGVDAAHDGRAIVPFDPDGDGDLDLALWTLGGLVFYENTGEPTGWTRLALEPKAAPRIALGARVEVRRGDVIERRHVALVEGFQSQIDPDVHVGLGAAPDGATVGTSIEIEWPSGERETIEDAPAGRRLVVREGEGVARADEVPAWPYRALPEDPDLTWAKRLAHAIRAATGPTQVPKPLVIRVRDDLSGPEPPRDGPIAAAAEGVRFVDVGPRTGTVVDASVDRNRTLLVELDLVAQAVGAYREVTIVYDARDMVLRIFRGPAEPAAVAAFCRLASDERAFPHLLIEHGRLALEEARYREALLLFDRALRDRTDLSPVDAAGFEGMGRAQVLLGRIDLAVDAYRGAVDLDPDYALGHINLGAALSRLERFDEAVLALQEARRVEGDSQRVLGALAEAAASADRHELARESAMAYLATAPDDVAMTVLLGKVEARAGVLDRAAELFERALELEPPNEEARSALGAVKRLLGERSGG